jgi:hypothetical protein
MLRSFVFRFCWPFVLVSGQPQTMQLGSCVQWPDVASRRGGGMVVVPQICQ